MLQFTVPQFIDVEDKIIGPITARQFLIMLTGFMFIGVSYKIFRFSWFIVIGIFIFGVFGVFAFLKVNGMPFHNFTLNFIQTSKRPFLRVWNNIYNKDIPVKEEVSAPPEVGTAPKPTFTTSRLAELSLVVDTQGSYGGEREAGQTDIKFSDKSNIDKKIEDII